MTFVLSTAAFVLWNFSALLLASLQYLLPYTEIGRARAETVSLWLPTAVARVRAWVWQMGFVVDKMASGQVFSENFGFRCQNRLFHELLHPHNHRGS
jgi:hypothetical protein